MERLPAPERLPLDNALATLAAAIPGPTQGAVRADRDDPAADRSAMDGAALRASDGLAPRHVLGTIFAGDGPVSCKMETATCYRIMTGAVLPPGADAVVPVEHLRTEGECLVPEFVPAAGEHIRPKGSQARAGEELLAAGLCSTAPRLGLRSQVGTPAPPLKRLRVDIAPTGDELTAEPLPHQIRDSNGPMLAALAHRLGAEARLHAPLPDDPQALAPFFLKSDADILLTVGGVSRGQKDHLPEVLAGLGADILFHRILLKPGMPLLAAILDGKVVLALPGNPASAYVDALLFLPVAMAKLQGFALPDPWRSGTLEEAVPNPGDRPLLHPCLRAGARLKPLPSRGSGDLVRLAQAEALAWIPADATATGNVRYVDIL